MCSSPSSKVQQRAEEQTRCPQTRYTYGVTPSFLLLTFFVFIPTGIVSLSSGLSLSLHHGRHNEGIDSRTNAPFCSPGSVGRINCGSPRDCRREQRIRRANRIVSRRILTRQHRSSPKFVVSKTRASNKPRIRLTVPVTSVLAIRRII